MNDQLVDCILTGASGPSAHVCPVDIPPAATAAEVPVPRIKQKQNSRKQRSVICHVSGCKNNLVKAYDKVSTKQQSARPSCGSFDFFFSDTARRLKDSIIKHLSFIDNLNAESTNLHLPSQRVTG
jgi:hypothetical protein